MVEIINSLEDLCRLCAGKIDVLMGINIFESDHRQIFKKICVCLPIQVSEDDSFPKMVCVECACKLDLMFDFRERSILTAHLFSDMMTVNSRSVITVEHAIPIESETVTDETDFGGDFISCKLETVKYNPGLTGEVCPAGNETNIQQDTIALQPASEILPKFKTASSKSLGKAKIIDVTACKGSETITLLNPLELEKTSSKVYIQAESQSGNGRMGDKELSTGQLELSSLHHSTDAGQADCTRLDWFFCSLCDRSFADKEEFDMHCHSEKGEDVAAAAEPGATVDEEAAAGQDVLNVETHPNKRKKAKQKKETKVKEGGEKKAESKVCMECGKQYQTNYKLQEHMRKHTGEKPYLCSYQECKKAFRSKIGLAQHEANHSGQFEFSCSTCGKGFQCKSYLVVHQRVHSDLKPYACKQCSRRFKTKQSLLDHMNRHLGVKPYLCDICGRGFITKGLCKSHQKVHSGTDNRQYPCNVCRKLFVSKSYLNIHFRIHTGEKPFICEVCGKGFLTRVDLRIHSTMHTGEKSFVCEMCGKAFARRDALRCHRRSHTGERPYKCEFCGQSFTQFSPMAIHKRLHTGERPYECDVCQKAFVSRSTMRSHRKKHHGNEESQFQLVAVEVQQEDQPKGHVEENPQQQLVVIENTSQLLLALSKRHPEPVGSEIVSIHKLKNENSTVPVE